MKNTFIIAMFIFWGFIVAVVSAGYIVKQNRLAQESMQKTYVESLQKITDSFVQGKVNTASASNTVPVVTSPKVTPTAPKATVTKPVTPNPVTVVTPTPTPTPTPVPAPVVSSGPTMATVALHNTQSDCWIVISGKVYSVASYIPMHPGGARKITDRCGGDATSPYARQGHSSYANSLLGSYLVGTLQ